MHLIKVRFKDAKDFSAALNVDVPKSKYPIGGMFCPTTTRLEDGEKILMEIIFPGMPNKMIVGAEVLSWRSAVPRKRVRAGAVVGFDPEDKEKVEYIVKAAKGSLPAAAASKRRYKRLPFKMDVEWRRDGELEDFGGTLLDISVGGALLSAKEKIAVGSKILIKLVPPGGAGAITIAGEISNKKKDQYGVAFQFRYGGGSRRLKEVIKRLVSERIVSADDVPKV